MVREKKFFRVLIRFSAEIHTESNELIDRIFPERLVLPRLVEIGNDMIVVE
mgnify:CR=1 FL=1